MLYLVFLIIIFIHDSYELYEKMKDFAEGAAVNKEACFWMWTHFDMNESGSLDSAGTIRSRI